MLKRRVVNISIVRKIINCFDNHLRRIEIEKLENFIVEKPVTFQSVQRKFNELLEREYRVQPPPTVDEMRWLVKFFNSHEFIALHDSANNITRRLVKRREMNQSSLNSSLSSSEMLSDAVFETSFIYFELIDRLMKIDESVLNSQFIEVESIDAAHREGTIEL